MLLVAEQNKMPHIKTYELLADGERELVSEEIHNTKGQVIAIKEYSPIQNSEEIKEYDDSGQLIKEVEIIDGLEGSRVEYEYNSEGQILSLKQFLSGDVFQETRFEYLGSKTIERTIQNGVELSRTETTEEESTLVKEYYMQNELFEIRSEVFNPVTRSKQIRITDETGRLIETELQRFDQSQNLIKSEEKRSDGTLLKLSEYKYKNGKLIFEKHDDHDAYEYYELSYEYDQHGNEVNWEKRTNSGQLLSFEKKQFNDKNQLIKNVGVSANGTNYDYEFEITEM